MLDDGLLNREMRRRQLFMEHPPPSRSDFRLQLPLTTHSLGRIDSAARRCLSLQAG